MLHVPHLSSFWMLLFYLLCFPPNTHTETHTFYLHILIIWCLLTKLASWSITKLVQSVSEWQNAWVTAYPLTLLCFLPLDLLWILSTPIFCSLTLAWEAFFHLFTFNLPFSYPSVQFSPVAQSCLTLRPHESQHARPPCPSQTPRVYSHSCPSSWWCHPAISSSVLFSSDRGISQERMLKWFAISFSRGSSQPRD